MHGSGKVGGGSGLIPNLDHVEAEVQARQGESATGPALVDVGQLAAPVPGTKVDPTSAQVALHRGSNGATASRCSTVETARAAGCMATSWDALPPSVKAFLTTVGRPDVNSTRLAELAKAMDRCTAPTHWPDRDLLTSIG
jgi:hypothetical protein